MVGNRRGAGILSSSHLSVLQRHLLSQPHSFLYEPFCINYLYLILFPALSGAGARPSGAGRNWTLLPQPGLEVLGCCTASHLWKLGPRELGG